MGILMGELLVYQRVDPFIFGHFLYRPLVTPFITGSPFRRLFFNPKGMIDDYQEVKKC